MRKVSCPFALVLLLLFCTYSSAAEGIIFEDPFHKKLEDGWSWLREVSEDWRITDKGLEIKMEKRAGDEARNILFRKVPKESEGPFDVSVEVKTLQPYTEQYQQAGLYWMQDGKLKLKFVLERIDGEIYVFPGKKPLKAEHVVLRLRIDGTKVIGEYQPEATGEFLEAFEAQLPDRNDETDQISLQCWQGPADAEHWIRFQKFMISQNLGTEKPEKTKTE